MTLKAALSELRDFFKHPIQTGAIIRDYIQTKQAVLFLRQHHFSAQQSKVAMVAVASASIYEAKLEAMLAVGLKLRGFRVVVLLPKSWTWVQRYCRAFGINTFVFWEDAVLSSEQEEKCLSHAKKLLAGEISFKTIKMWRYEHAWIGPQLIASVCRGVMQGAPDFSDPVLRKRLEGLLPDALKTVEQSRLILAEWKPTLMLVVEANYARMGALVDTAIAQETSVIQINQPYKDDALLFKRLTAKTRRSHPASVELQTLIELENMKWTRAKERELQEEFERRYGGAWFLQRRNQPNVKKKTRAEITAELRLDPHKKNAVVFSHLLWDANLFYGEDLFDDYGHWFLETVRVACRNMQVNWLIKLHPANLWKRAREDAKGELAEISLIKKHIGVLPPHVHLLYPDTEISTWSLFQITDYGITVRGTVGMELPCFGVPVFTAGTGRFSGLGFTHDSSSRHEYLEKLSKIQTFSRLNDEEVLRAKRHAYAVFLLRPWTMKSFRALFKYEKKGTHPLDHNLFCNAASMREIIANQDLEPWASWAENPKLMDYLSSFTREIIH